MPSRGVPLRCVPSRRVRVLEAGQKRFNLASTSLRVQIQFMAVVTGRVVTGARGSGSIGDSQAGQVWIHSMPSRVRFRFTSSPAGKLDTVSWRASQDLPNSGGLEVGLFNAC